MELATILTHPDILRWHENIADLFENADDASLPQRLSGMLNGVIDHETYIIKLYRANCDFPLVLAHNIPASQRAVYLGKYFPFACLEDPLLEKLRDGAPQIVQINHQTCSLAGSSYYRKYYRHLNLQDEIDVLFPMPNGDAIVLSMDWRKRTATSKELAALENIYSVVKSIITRYYRSYCGDTAVINEEPDNNHKKINSILTGREREIVNLMISGKGTKALARHLDISYQTVKVHRRNIYSKLGINSELQLCSMFVTPPPDNRKP